MNDTAPAKPDWEAQYKALIPECEMLKCENRELHCQLEKRDKDISTLEMTATELKERVKFLEGQIEAYRYCVNCKR